MCGNDSEDELRRCRNGCGSFVVVVVDVVVVDAKATEKKVASFVNEKSQNR